MKEILKEKISPSRVKLFRAIADYFSEAMPSAKSELNYRNPFELLVAVILSAQCTDKRVNIVTPPLFEAMGSAEKMAASSVEEIFGFIRSVSFPNAKSEHLHSMARRLMEFHDGEVPSDRVSLEKLSGVGRKTANVVLSVAFGESEFAVDTHVFRVAARIGLSRDAKTPLDTELQLVAGFAKAGYAERLGDAHHWLILHGRYVCTARKPKCEECGITTLCTFYNTQKPLR